MSPSNEPIPPAFFVRDSQHRQRQRRRASSPGPSNVTQPITSFSPPGLPSTCCGPPHTNHYRCGFAWLRETNRVIDGHPLTPFSRAAMAGEVTSSLTHWGTGCV